MAENASDARVGELRLLTNLEKCGSQIESAKLGAPDRDMIAFLIFEGYVNGIGGQGWSYDQEFGRLSALQLESNRLWRQIQYERWESMNLLLGGQQLRLSISHKGRVRLAELRQALKTGRDRDPSGVLIDQRHVRQGVQLAILDASAESPLSVAFLDLNGLKAINDNLGHAKGNDVIRVFFETVSSVIEGRAEAYRNGGDEVVVVAPCMNSAAAKRLLTQILTSLVNEREDGIAGITSSCGITTISDASVDPDELIAKVDKIMYRAKQESKNHTRRVSTLAIEAAEAEVIAG